MTYQVYQVTHVHRHDVSTQIVIADANQAPPQAADFQLSDPVTYELHHEEEDIAIERIEALEPAINRLAEIEPDGEALRHLLSDARAPEPAWRQFEAVEGTFGSRPVAGGVISDIGLDIAGAAAFEQGDFLYIRRPDDGVASGFVADPRDPYECSYYCVSLWDVDCLAYADEPLDRPS